MLTIATIAYVGGALALLLVPSAGTLFAAVYGRLFDVVGWGMRPSYLDVPANILLFFPLGLLAVLWLRSFARGFAVAVALSVVAELTQVFLPERDASPRDILSNAIGAALGAVVALLILRRRKHRGGPSRQAERPPRRTESTDGSLRRCPMFWI